MLRSTYGCFTFPVKSHAQCTLWQQWRRRYLFATGLTTIDTYSSSHTHTSTVPDHRRCLTSAHPTTSAHCCLYSSFSFQYRYQPYILTISMQPARPGRRAQMTHRHSLHSAIPRGLCIVLVYPSRPCHYERWRKETGKATVAPLGISSCVTLLYWLVSHAHLGKQTVFNYFVDWRWTLNLET